MREKSIGRRLNGILIVMRCGRYVSAPWPQPRSEPSHREVILCACNLYTIWRDHHEWTIPETWGGGFEELWYVIHATSVGEFVFFRLKRFRNRR